MPNRFTTSTKKDGVGREKGLPLTVIVPAAGMGHRMKSYGPKCLLQANQKETILEKTVINVKREYPYADIIVVVGFESTKVINSLPHYVRIVENPQFEETSVVESIRLGINASATKNLLLIYGDLIFNVYSIRNLISSGPCAVIDSKSRFKDEEVGVTVVDDSITMFAYGLPNKWSQIIYFENESFDMLKDLCSDKRKNKLYPFELFNIIIENGIEIEAKEPKGMVIKEIDSLKDL
jgi:choline kinase